jgi:hypothetical protein
LIGTKRIDGRRYRLADRCRISRIVFAAFDVGFDIGRKHEPRVVPELLEFACPLMCRCTCFHANEARRQIGKKLQNLRSTNTPPDHHRAIRIDAVNLKY